MATLADGQFEIDGYVFGGVWDGLKIDKVDFPDMSWDTQDFDNMFDVGMLMGQDRLRSGEITFELRTDTYSIDDAKGVVNSFAHKWLKSGSRSPRDISILRYRIGNRTMRVYGRGRKFKHGLDGWSLGGASPVLCTFQMQTPFFFADDFRSQRLTYMPEVTGGLIHPLKDPLTAKGTQATSVNSALEDVGGDAPTPIVIRFYGPTASAVMKGDGWSVAYNAPIPAGGWVQIDTRFGYATCYDNAGRIVNGNLGWSTNLTKARVAPPTELLYYTGVDPTNTSYATVTWWPAYYSY